MPEHNREYPDHAYNPARSVTPEAHQMRFRAGDEVNLGGGGFRTDYDGNIRGTRIAAMTGRPGQDDHYEAYGPDTEFGAAPTFGSFDEAADHVAGQVGYTRTQSGSFVPATPPPYRG